MTREQLKKDAQQFIKNPNLMVAESYGYKWLKDLIARQNAYIDLLEGKIAAINELIGEVVNAPNCDQKFYQLRLAEKIVTALKGK